MAGNPDVGSVPTQSELMNPTLRALHALGRSASVGEITNRVIEGYESAAAHHPNSPWSWKADKAQNLIWVGQELVSKTMVCSIIQEEGCGL